MSGYIQPTKGRPRKGETAGNDIIERGAVMKIRLAVLAKDRIYLNGMAAVFGGK